MNNYDIHIEMEHFELICSPICTRLTKALPSGNELKAFGLSLLPFLNEMVLVS